MGRSIVRRVDDKIEVVYDTDPADITQHVQDALARHALIPDDSDVAADTFGSAVRLTGHVRTWAEHDAVVSATWMANGVTEVIDELEVTSSTTWSRAGAHGSRCSAAPVSRYRGQWLPGLPEPGPEYASSVWPPRAAYPESPAYRLRRAVTTLHGRRTWRRGRRLRSGMRAQPPVRRGCRTGSEARPARIRPGSWR